MDPTAPSDALRQPLATAIALYTVVLFGVALYARTRVADRADFLVAGRRLGLPFSTATHPRDGGLPGNAILLHRGWIFVVALLFDLSLAIVMFVRLLQQLWAESGARPGTS